MCFPKVPKLSENQQNSENQKALLEAVGPKKQVSYKTEIIGGVPIVTQTQVHMTQPCSAPHTCVQAYIYKVKCVASKFFVNVVLLLAGVKLT